MSDCPHEATGDMSIHHCRDCGDVLIDGEWVPDPVMMAELERTAAEVVARKWKEAHEKLEAENAQLRAVVEAVPGIVEKVMRQVRADHGSLLAGDPDTIRDHVRAVLVQLDVSGERTPSEEALRFVGDAAGAFIGARDRWHAEAARQEAIPDVEFQRAYDDALDALVHAVRQLDVSEEGT